MMFSKMCRCGQSQKNFHKDIGEFYIAECCELAGFDHLGECKNGTPADVKPTVLDRVTQLVDAAKAVTQTAVVQMTPTPSRTNPNRPGRGKLRDMRREDVANLAQSYGIPVSEAMTKAQIIEEIHK